MKPTFLKNTGTFLKKLEEASKQDGEKCCINILKNVAIFCKMLTKNSRQNQHFWKMLEE
jgi:hypothetical protein